MNSIKRKFSSNKLNEMKILKIWNASLGQVYIQKYIYI